MPAACSGSPSRPAAWPCRCVRDRIDPQAVAQALEQDPTISHVALVYSETSSGICHDAPAIARVAQALGRRVIIDAVSAFGALPLDLSDLPAVDAVALTANKCLEGLPGAAFVVARREPGRRAGPRRQLVAGPGRHLSAKPAAQCRAALHPPAPTLAAFAVALARYHEEGREARLARYTANMRALYQGVGEIGLTPWLPPALQGPIVVNVLAPDTPAWDLQAFVDALKRRGYVLSNFKNTEQPSFRVGCIGAFSADQMRQAVQAMGEALSELGIRGTAAGQKPALPSTLTA